VCAKFKKDIHKCIGDFNCYHTSLRLADCWWPSMALPMVILLFLLITVSQKSYRTAEHVQFNRSRIHSNHQWIKCYWKAVMLAVKHQWAQARLSEPTGVLLLKCQVPVLRLCGLCVSLCRRERDREGSDHSSKLIVRTGQSWCQKRYACF